MSSTDLQGKTALVTGAGQGIGRSVVRALLKRGCQHVVALDISQALLDELNAEFASENGRVSTVRVDVGDWNATKAALGELLARPGFRLHLLVNNAGILDPLASFLDISHDSIRKMWNVNIKAMLNISQLVSSHMREHGIAGAIVNVSSVGAHYPFPGHSLYSLTKAAVDSITRSLAVELAQHKIRVNSINPYIVNTPMLLSSTRPEDYDYFLAPVPWKRFIEPEEVANGICFLLSDRASHTTGSHLRMDGGRLLN